MILTYVTLVVGLSSVPLRGENYLGSIVSFHLHSAWNRLCYLAPLNTCGNFRALLSIGEAQEDLFYANCVENLCHSETMSLHCIGVRGNRQYICLRGL